MSRLRIVVKRRMGRSSGRASFRKNPERSRRQVGNTNERKAPSVKANYGGSLFAFLKKGGTVLSLSKDPFNVPKYFRDVEGAFCWYEMRYIYDAALVENEFDHPHQVKAGPEIIAAMTFIVGEIVKIAKIPIGVEVLLNDPKASLAIAAGSDGIIITGSVSGQPPTVGDLQEAKDASAGKAPVLVGSGFFPSNARSLLTHADGAIVGTAIKTGKNVDVIKATTLMNRVKKFQ